MNILTNFILVLFKPLQKFLNEMNMTDSQKLLRKQKDIQLSIKQVWAIDDPDTRPYTEPVVATVHCVKKGIVYYYTNFSNVLENSTINEFKSSFSFQSNGA